MSTKISRKKFTELLRTIIKKEIEEVNTTASVGVAYDGDGTYKTPHAFSGKGKDRRSKISSGSGYEKVNEGVTEKLHTYVVESGWWADASDKTKANYIKQHGSPPNTATDDTAGDPDDAWDDEEGRAKPTGKTDADAWDDDEEARAAAFADMEDEFDIDFDESVKEALPNRVWMDLRKKYSTNELKRFFKKEYVNEDTKDVVKAKKLSRQIEKIESKYRKAMYDLSDRLQADPKNHKLQDELVKSYTKHVTSFMRDMVKITKRVK
tara:strand:- start:1205 stop:1999 length:795 start_codon:yes stop_codon:yes gene_type:complete